MATEDEIEAASMAISQTFSDFGLSIAWQLRDACARAALEAAEKVRVRALPKIRCDSCDNGIDEEWTYCPFCGAQERKPAPNPRQENTTPTKSNT
jgi:hypothetical protein